MNNEAQNQNTPPAANNPGSGNVSAMASMMGAHPNLASQLETVVNPPAPLVNTAPPAGTPPAANPAANTPPATNTPASVNTPPASNEPTPAPVQPEFIETALGKIPISKTEVTPATPPAKIETFEQAFGTQQVMNVFGMPISTPAEFIEKVLPNVEKWRKDSAQVGEVKTKYENLSQSFAGLDPLVKDVVNASIEGAKNNDDSWKSMLNVSPTINFKDPVEKVDQKLLVDNYFPGQFTSEDLADKENKAAQIAISASSERYKSDKEKRDLSIKQKIDAEAQRRQNVSVSLQAAVDKVNDYLPVQQDPGRIAQIKEKMENGQWASAFFNADGTWNEKAAANLALAEYGNETFGTLINVISNKAKSEANEDIVDRGAVNRNNGSGAGQNPQKHQQDENINALTGLMSVPKSHF